MRNVYAYTKLITHNATKIIVAQDHITDPPMFDNYMILQHRRNTLSILVTKHSHHGLDSCNMATNNYSKEDGNESSC